MSRLSLVIFGAVVAFCSAMHPDCSIAHRGELKGYEHPLRMTIEPYHDFASIKISPDVLGSFLTGVKVYVCQIHGLHMTLDNVKLFYANGYLHAYLSTNTLPVRIVIEGKSFTAPLTLDSPPGLENGPLEYNLRD